ncbi:PEFG-CTERM sorting domain-containing protein [Nitrosopumilus sp.]|uniref:PEFG-CTERM sorting domain-containing protein n=1 Tax=Nitrosopumilus sp. TaxID=2024843 RepID=UPI003B599EF2
MLTKLIAVLIVLSFATTTAFADQTLEVSTNQNEIKALDSVMIVGKITGVSEYKPVRLSVMAPDGAIVYKPFVPIGDNGEFKRVLQPTLPSFMAGTYTITVSHEDTKMTAMTQFTVIGQEIPRNSVQVAPGMGQPSSGIAAQEQERSSIVQTGITMTADAIEGSDTINITGNTNSRGTDVTLVVSSPTGNVVTVAQVTPGPTGNFDVEIKVGGAMWKEDGMYTITANQGRASEYQNSIEVEIKEGVVVPEFGAIATLVLMVSVFAVVILSARTKLGIMPKY